MRICFEALKIATAGRYSLLPLGIFAGVAQTGYQMSPGYSMRKIALGRKRYGSRGKSLANAQGDAGALLHLERRDRWNIREYSIVMQVDIICPKIFSGTGRANEKS